MSEYLRHGAADIVQQLLIDLALGSEVGAGDDWPVYSGMTPDSPDDCITCVNMDARYQGRLHPTGEPVEHPGVKIRFRSAQVVDGYVRGKRVFIALGESVRNTEVLMEDGTLYRIHAMTVRNPLMNLGEERVSSRWIHDVNYTLSLTLVSLGTGTGSV